MNKILPENITINVRIILSATVYNVHIPSEHVISSIKYRYVHYVQVTAVQWAACNNDHYYYDFIKTRFFVYIHVHKYYNMILSVCPTEVFKV